MRIYEFTTTTISLYNYNFESAKRNTSNAILQMGNFLFFLHLILIEEYFMVFVVNSFCLCFDWRHFLESKKKKWKKIDRLIQKSKFYVLWMDSFSIQFFLYFFSVFGILMSICDLIYSHCDFIVLLLLLSPNCFNFNVCSI